MTALVTRFEEELSSVPGWHSEFLELEHSHGAGEQRNDTEQESLFEDIIGCFILRSVHFNDVFFPALVSAQSVNGDGCRGSDLFHGVVSLLRCCRSPGWNR